MKAKTFEELERWLNGSEPDFKDETLTAKEFAQWLDEHGYKTFPDAPDYVS